MLDILKKFDSPVITGFDADGLPVQHPGPPQHRARQPTRHIDVATRVPIVEGCASL